jgi:hypothetical protein
MSEGDGEDEGLGDGDDDREPAGVGAGDGLADGVEVGPSASAAVPKQHTVRATARSGGAR